MVGGGAVGQASCCASGFQWFFKPGCLRTAERKTDMRHQKSKLCDHSSFFLQARTRYSDTYGQGQLRLRVNLLLVPTNSPAATFPPAPSLPDLSAHPPPGWPLWAPHTAHRRPRRLQEESPVHNGRPGLVALDARSKNIKALPRPAHVPKYLWHLMLAGRETQQLL